MKKVIVLSLLSIGLVAFSEIASAEETLLDNNLELKTDRLNNDQADNGKAQSFIVADQLFEAEMIEKVAQAKEQEQKQKEADQAAFFLTKTPKVKQLDHTQLFAGNDTQHILVKNREETAEAVSSPPALFPLILGLALITVVTLVLYHSRKRG